MTAPSGFPASTHKASPGPFAALFEWFGRESVRRSCLLGVETVLILVTAVLLDVLSRRENPRFDLTPTKQYSLAPIMQKVLHTLDQPIRVTIFYKRGDRDTQDELLGLMAQENPLFSYRLFDLDRTPGMAQQYGVSSYGTGVVETRGKKLFILKADQEGIQKAILRLSQPAKTIYFVSGHGERDLTDQLRRTGYGLLRRELATENYQVRPLSLDRAARVPEDADVVVVSGPREEFLPDELAALSAYLSAGGKAIFMIDPYTVPGLCQYLTRFGFVLTEGVVVDTQNRLAGGDPLMPAIPNFVEDVFPRDLLEPILMPVVRPVEGQEGKVQAFAFSSPDSWVQRSRERIEQGDLWYLAEEDTPGPVPVAAIATIGNSGEQGGNVVVLGDSDFVTNFYAQMPGNVDFFVNTVEWLLRRGELVSAGRAVQGLVGGRSAVQGLYLSQTQARLFFWIGVVLEPSLVFLVGTIVFFSRRWRR